MGGENAQKWLAAHERNLEKNKALKGSQLQTNKNAMSIQNGVSKENGHFIRFSVNKFASQFKKSSPLRRSGSPLNWFPRKKTDSFLKRKIKRLQEVGGMNSTLDETLGDANPHYTRMTKEKIAAREATRKAMEARKAVMVEASWCRILRAARIQSKGAEAELEKAEKNAAEAFEVARSMGVMMYDQPDGPRRSCEIESSLAVGGASTHKVTAAFETAFEVDKEVAASVKRAFIQLASSSSSEKEEFKDLLRKINQNPETDRESSTGSSSEVIEDDAAVKKFEIEMDQRKPNPTQDLIDASKSRDLASTMLERLKCLQEDELASLAVIVATCGLNAALLEVESSKDHRWEPASSCPVGSAGPNGAATRRNSCDVSRLEREVPSLDKFLVKHVSRLEREVQEARNSKESNLASGLYRASGASKEEPATSDLGSILVKHVSRFEREIQEAKKSQKKASVLGNGRTVENGITSSGAPLIEEEAEKVMSEKEMEVKKQRDVDLRGKENMEHNILAQSPKHMTRIEKAKLEAVKAFSSQDEPEGLDKILVKPVHRLERRKMLQSSDIVQTKSSPVKLISRIERARLEVLEAFSSLDEQPSGLDQILVKPVSRLEREKMQLVDEYTIKRGSKKQGTEVTALESLDKIFVNKRDQQFELGKAKLAAAQQSEDEVKQVDARREARERELQEAWGGLSLGNSIRPSVSRLERDKAAWRIAEEEERRQARCCEVEPLTSVEHGSFR